MARSPDEVRDLRDFIELLKSRDELRQVGAEVDPCLEVAAITAQVSKGAAGGRALLFERVRGHRWPVVTNLYGSHRRAAWAVGAASGADLQASWRLALAEIAATRAEDGLRGLLDQQPAPSMIHSAAAPCREVWLPRPDALSLPALRSWPGDGGRYLTLPLVFTRDPDTGAGNCGLYRVQLFADGSLAVRWKPGSDAARHCAAWHRRGRAMPVAIALGGDPALLFAAAFALPPDADELALAAWLRGRPMVMTPCLASDLAVPAAAEFVLEGLVEPGAEGLEGPFGNHTGSYQAAAPAPLLRLTSMSYRHAPVLPATVVGPPPMEDCYLAALAGHLLLPLLQMDFPDIVDLHLPLEGIFHGNALLSVRPGCCGRSLIQALWRHGPLRHARLLVVLPAAVPLRDAANCYWHVLNHAWPERDLVMADGRLGIDATAGGAAAFQDHGPAMSGNLRRRWREYGLEP